MADTLEIFGDEFTNVAGIKATDDNNQIKTYIRPQGTKSITQNGTGIDVTNYASVDVSVSGGGGIGTLLKTQSLGSISTSSTNATDTGLTVTVDNINSYDLLIVDISVDTVVSGRHLCTISTLCLSANSDINTKDEVASNTQKQNMRIGSTSARIVTSYNATNTGLYPMNASISNGSLTFQIYKKYNATATGTINGAYTARVYGINLYDLIGG